MRQRLLVLAFSALILPHPAVAQDGVAPDALWQTWREGNGFVTATGTVASSANGNLTVSAPEIRIGELVLDAERIELVQDGEATRIDLPELFTLSQGEVTASIAAPDLVLTATGAASDPTYTLNSPSLTAALAGPSVTGTLGAELLDATIAPTSTEASADTLRLASEDGMFEAARTGVTLFIDGPLDAVIALATGTDGEDVTLQLDAESFRQTIVTEGEENTFVVRTAESSETLSRTDNRFDVAQELVEVGVTITGNGLPVEPVRMSVESASLAIEAPAMVSDEASDASLDLELSGLTVDETVWSLFDPDRTLDRTPASLELSVIGHSTRVDAANWRPERMGLDTFRMTALGAELTAQGSVAFMNHALPYGRPVGTFAATLTGATALLDSLQSLGTIPNGPLTGARLGLGFFTRPGEGPDTLVTTVDIGADGIVTVNDRQITQIPNR